MNSAGSRNPTSAGGLLRVVRPGVIGLLILAPTLPGCAVVSVAGAVAGAAISVGGAVISTGVTVTGKVIGKTIDLITPDSAAAAPSP